MPKRIDFYDDPNAPAANSVVPSVNVVIENDVGEILMIERSDNGNWALPGGAIDLGESMSQAGVRETKEETGINCEILDVLGIYTDPKHIILYTSVAASTTTSIPAQRCTLIDLRHPSRSQRVQREAVLRPAGPRCAAIAGG
jgi:ADP-ribose pyrophosphatase YjhB (NUDIX family)